MIIIPPYQFTINRVNRVIKDVGVGDILLIDIMGKSNICYLKIRGYEKHLKFPKSDWLNIW